MAKKRFADIEYTESSGNVFSDLDISNPEEAAIKAQITLKIQEIIEKKNRTQKKRCKNP